MIRPGSHRALSYDWNAGPQKHPVLRSFDLLDSTLRDGLHSPSVTIPSAGQKIQLLMLMRDVGIRSADIGMPAMSHSSYHDVLEIAKYAGDHRIGMELACTGRTMKADIDPIIDISQRTGQKITAYLFIGSSRIRQWVEKWDLSHILRTSALAVDHAVDGGLEVAFVTEDTTRTFPEDLRDLYLSAIEHGAKRIEIADTVGYADPDGTKRIVQFARTLINESGEDVKLDWHGHNDRGLAVINSITALGSGADRVHACGLGIGERTGNTSMEQLLVNLYLLGWIDHPLTRLHDYVCTVSEYLQFPIPSNFPLSGTDAFRTSTGTHASAIIKAYESGDMGLADMVYSSVPARHFGRQQQIEIGPNSGISNVLFWFRTRGIDVPDIAGRKILSQAKTAQRVLTEAEIFALYESFIDT